MVFSKQSTESFGRHLIGYDTDPPAQLAYQALQTDHRVSRPLPEDVKDWNDLLRSGISQKYQPQGECTTIRPPITPPNIWKLDRQTRINAARVTDRRDPAQLNFLSPCQRLHHRLNPYCLKMVNIIPHWLVTDICSTNTDHAIAIPTT